MFVKHSQGTVNRQAQTQWPAGTYEEHHGREGFAGECSQLYRRHPTTSWTRVEGPIRHRGIALDDFRRDDEDDIRAAPTLLLYNDDVRVSVTKRSNPTPFYSRNLDGDITILVQRGSGRLVTDYGVLDYAPFEYLVIPKGTNYRLMPEGGQTFAYLIETTSAIRIPDRGLIGHFLPFDVAVMDLPRLTPSTPPGDGSGEWEIVVQRDGALSSIFYPFDPMDVEGWQGTVTPFRLRLSDIRPLTAERLDVPPPIHATFETDGVWIVTMCPRPWQTGDAAMMQPYHRNVDYDEVYITLGGGDPIPGGPPDGFLSVIPAGMNHGPSAAMLNMSSRGLMTRFPLYMFNMDTRRSVHYTDAFIRNEVADYNASQQFDATPLLTAE